MTKINYSKEDSLKIKNLSKNSDSLNSLYPNSQITFDSFDEKGKNINKLEHLVYKYFKNKYRGTKNYYNIKAIDNIINNYNSHLVTEFKDYLIMGDISEFLQKNYGMNEIKQFLKILIDYYEISSLIFPSYVLLPEKKYIFKNIRKKQKIINKQQEEIEKNKIKNGENSNIFFNTLTLNSIFNQTNSSNLKLFFDINKKEEKDNDNDIKKIYKNIAKNEIKIKQEKYIKERKNLEIKIKDEKINQKKSSINKKEINEKIQKDKSINKNKISKKIIKEIFKTEENSLNKTDKIKINIDKNISINKKRDIINNNLELKKSSKLKQNIGHVKTNTCIFDKNENNYIIQRIYSKKNNKSKDNIFKKIFKFKLKKRNDQKNSKENITSLFKSKIRNKSSLLQIDSSFNSLFKKCKTKRIISKHKKLESIVPNFNINTDKNKLNKLSVSLKINDSYSSPNLYDLNTIKFNKTKENKKIKSKILYKANNKRKNEKLSPLNSLLNIFDTINSINNNSTRKNYELNLFKNKSNIIHNKNQKIKSKRIIRQSNTSKYINTFNNKIDLNTSNKTTRILKHKNNNNIFKSIPAFKKINNVIKKKRNSEINNNVNINININSNNIYNNLNNSKNIFINDNNKHNITINNNKFNKKNIYSLFRQQSTSFAFKKITNTNAIKNLLLSSISNSNIQNNSKNIYSIFNKNNIIKKKSNPNDIISLSRCLTSRNSIDINKIKTKLKKLNKNLIKGSKSNIYQNILKKEKFKKNQ